MHYNPHDHYWRRADGTAFSSRRRLEVPAGDPEFLAWLAAGNLATAYPKDGAGGESVAELDAVLAPYGLRTGRPAPADLRRAAYEAEADPLLATHQRYQAEADAWSGLEGAEGYDPDAAAEAAAKAAEAAAEYLARKREIRERHPDSESGTGEAFGA